MRKALAFIQFWWRARLILNRLQSPDVIYASTTPPTVGELGRRLARRRRTPWVLEVVDVWPDVPIGMGLITNPILRDFLHWAVGRLYHDAGHIVALSEGMAQQIASHRVPPEKISVVHNGTDIQVFKPIENQCDGNAPVRLLYTGAIGRANGVQALIRVMAQLTNDANLPPHELHIYGWGAELAEIQLLTKLLNLGNVHFYPPVPKEQLAQLMPTFDLGVVTFAQFEVLEANSANKFYDYLAAGLPVVLNYEGWQAEYLTHWQCGLSAPMGNEDAFTDSLRRLIADAPLRQSMRPRARQLAEVHFSRELLARQVLEVLASQAFE